MNHRLTGLVVLPLLFGACGMGPRYESGLTPLAPGVEAVSVMGQPLMPRVIPPEERIDLDANLDQALKRYEQAPEEESSVIWLGRRLAYLGRYREAVNWYTRGLNRHPDSFRLLRHRGHRYITLRHLDRAVEDLSRAAELTAGHPDEVEPDGAPNRFNIPRSTTQSNIWYHLGLARFLRGELEEAAEAYRRCLELARNDDMWCASANWANLILRRLGREEEAAAIRRPVHEDMEILENHAYHDLLRLHEGQRDPDELLDPDSDAIQNATLAYGVAAWHQLNGDEDRALEIYRQILAGPRWDAFGYIAAEADLARMHH